LKKTDFKVNIPNIIVKRHQIVSAIIPCENVLIQINAAKGALHKVGQVVLEGHINHCVRDGIEKPFKIHRL